MSVVPIDYFQLGKNNLISKFTTELPCFVEELLSYRQSWDKVCPWSGATNPGTICNLLCT